MLPEVDNSELKASQQQELIMVDMTLTRFSNPKTSRCPSESHPTHGIASSESVPELGLCQPGCGTQLAFGIAWSPIFQIRIRSGVATAIHTPSGLNERLFTASGGGMLIEYFGLFSALRTFQTKTAPSSPPDTSNLSSSLGSSWSGCHRRQVTPPSWAGIDRRLPDSSQI